MNDWDMKEAETEEAGTAVYIYRETSVGKHIWPAAFSLDLSPLI